MDLILARGLRLSSDLCTVSFLTKYLPLSACYTCHVNTTTRWKSTFPERFYEAVSDAIGLSVFTPQHLHKIGLYKNITSDYDSSISFLMLMALRKVTYMPFAHIVDQWRWHVFSDGVEDMTAQWWELRLQYQSIVSHVPRSERNFDPAFKYDIPADSLHVK
ncbi:angiotensin-converting enzyme-like [Anoplolepis gracilipes]|uniref:angiotensin-converting enzyme-like n=1 Tax=Anoplolepis gracilipes TaxID=354296 RepID=UPI003BA23F37